MTYSKNKKLNTLLNMIEAEIFDSYENEAEALSEITRYYKEFPNEPDYNFAQYGNARVYYNQIYNLYSEAGYTSTDKYSTDQIWNTYKRQVGYVIRELLKSSTVRV